jgi:hypothetical protein
VLELTSKCWLYVQKYVGKRKEDDFGKSSLGHPRVAGGRPLITGWSWPSYCWLVTSGPRLARRPIVIGLRPVGDQRALPAVTRSLWGSLLFLAFLTFFPISFLCYEDGPRILGEYVYNNLIFWSLPLHLGGWILPFFMELGDFIFFQIYSLLKLEYTQTFIWTIGIFVLWKIEIIKNSSRITSVIEIFVPFFSARCIWVCSTHDLPLRFGTQLTNRMCITYWCKSLKLGSSKNLHRRQSKSAVPAGYKREEFFLQLQA